MIVFLTKLQNLYLLYNYHHRHQICSLLY